MAYRGTSAKSDPRSVTFCQVIWEAPTSSAKATLEVPQFPGLNVLDQIEHNNYNDYGLIVLFNL
jgi:hypothetical protein